MTQPNFDNAVIRSLTWHPGPGLQEAYEIMNALRRERAMYFTAGELLWIAADDRRVRFVNEEQIQIYLDEVRALRDRVSDRKVDWA